MPLPTSRIRHAALAALCLGTAPLGATHYVIGALHDSVAIDGVCSLREALLAAATDSAQDTCAAGSADDLVTLPEGELIWDGGVAVLASPAGTLTVEGPTSDRSAATVSCANAGAFLKLTEANLTLRSFSVSSCDSGELRGGAVWAELGSLTLLDMAFYSNQATDFGGAVYYAFEAPSGAGALRIEDTLFHGNTAADTTPTVADPIGGAVLVALAAEASATIVRSQFVDNTLVSATRPTLGAALFLGAQDQATITLRELELVDNRCGEAAANHFGCGLYVSAKDQAEIVVSGAVLTGNYSGYLGSTAQYDGAAFVLAHEVTLLAERLRLDGNVNPGAPQIGNIQLDIEVRDTVSAVARDVLAIHGQTGIVGFADYGSPTLLFDHVTAAGNDLGVGLWEGSTATIELQNSILWGNDDDLQTTGTPTLTANHEGGADPLFVDAGGGDYRLTSGSPDRDTGDKTLAGVGAFDLAHAPRVVGTQTDKGAFESGGLFADDFESGDTSAW